MQSTTFLAPPPPISLHAIFNASANAPAPNIDLDWEPFQSNVEEFLNAIDKYCLSAKTEIAARASDHVATVRDLKARKEETERQIQVEREKEGEMLSTLESERHALQDLTSSVNHLQTTLSKLREQSATISNEVKAIDKAVRTERAEKERQESSLEDMRSKDGPELVGLEEVLGWKVEGVKENVLLMRFTLIDPADLAREFCFKIDVSKQEYAVTHCSPPLPTMLDMVQQLNSDRDFFRFIKRVRKAFQSTVSLPNPTSKFDDLNGPSSRLPNGQTTSADVPPELERVATTLDSLML